VLVLIIDAHFDAIQIGLVMEFLDTLRSSVRRTDQLLRLRYEVLGRWRGKVRYRRRRYGWRRKILTSRRLMLMRLLVMMIVVLVWSVVEESVVLGLLLLLHMQLQLLLL
jgi:hypothetical protein